MFAVWRCAAVAVATTARADNPTVITASRDTRSPILRPGLEYLAPIQSFASNSFRTGKRDRAVDLAVARQRVDVVVGRHPLRVAEQHGDLGERAGPLVVGVGAYCCDGCGTAPLMPSASAFSPAR